MNVSHGRIRKSMSASDGRTRKKMNASDERPRKRSIGWCVVLTLLATGCNLMAGQFEVTYRIAAVMVTAGKSISAEEIDLTEDADFSKHRDEIERVEDVTFQLTAVNNGSTIVRARIYASRSEVDSLTLEQIETHAALVLESPELGMGESLFIPFDESRDYMHNLELVKDLTLSGHFFLYAVADSVPFDLELTDVTLVATLTYEE